MALNLGGAPAPRAPMLPTPMDSGAFPHVFESPKLYFKNKY